MTNKEALTCINEIMDSDIKYDIKYNKSINYQLTTDDYAWIYKAIIAVEKQIPLKPDVKTADGRKVYYCNVCGCGLCDDDGSEYCSFCGQKQDWSEDVIDNR